MNKLCKDLEIGDKIGGLEIVKLTKTKDKVIFEFNTINKKHTVKPLDYMMVD